MRPAGDHMPDAFISYAHQDKAFADGRGLEWFFKNKMPEITYWRDHRIGAGSVWAEDIRDNLLSAKCVVVIWSQNSWNSPWVRQEAFYGYMRGILVPMRVDDVVLEPPFNSIQTVRNDTRGYEAMVSAVRAKVAA